MSGPQHTESSTENPQLATRLPALRAVLEEQQLVATAAVTSILTSRIDPQDDVALRARDAALIALAVIDGALDRIDDRRYGICGRCGGPIAIERLNSLPAAELCLDCERRTKPAGRAMSAVPARAGSPRRRRMIGMEKTSLEGLAHKLLDLAAAGPGGRSASTVYGGREQTLRQTLLALTAGTSLSEHESPGEATVQVLFGRVRLLAGSDSWEGGQGDLMVIPPRRHALHAIEDTAVLLTVAKKA